MMEFILRRVACTQLKQFGVIWPAVVSEVKLKFGVRFAAKLRRNIGNLKMLPRSTFEAVENYFDGGQPIFAAERFGDKNIDE